MPTLSFETSIPLLTVFAQGLLSFFSPCVLPLVPLYLSYLAGGAKTVEADGTIRYHKGKVMLRTFFFVLGISASFFILGMGASALGSFFEGNRMLFAKIGGILIMVFGIYQLGVFGTSKTLSTEHRLPFRLNQLAMNPFTAFLMGFIFSFAWTPCVGPALTSVLMMTATSKAGYGYFLILVYTLGFVLPFLAVGLFTGQLLDLFRKHTKALQYTVKIGGLLMIIIGVMMMTGWMNGFTGYLSPAPQPTPPAAVSSETEESEPAESIAESVPAESVTESRPAESLAESRPAESVAESTPAAPEVESQPEQVDDDTLPIEDFTLTDQYGNTHTLSDYKGKVVFLNFWATWCGPCRSELPDIQKLYETYGLNEDEVVVLGVSAPNQSGEGSEAAISAFMEENGYTYPTLFDTTGEIFQKYGVRSFPTTFLINKNNRVLGYIPGAINYQIMEEIVQETLQSTQETVQQTAAPAAQPEEQQEEDENGRTSAHRPKED